MAFIILIFCFDGNEFMNPKRSTVLKNVCERDSISKHSGCQHLNSSAHPVLVNMDVTKMSLLVLQKHNLNSPWKSSVESKRFTQGSFVFNLERSKWKHLADARGQR